MVTAEDQRELLKVSYEMGELLVTSGYGSGKGYVGSGRTFAWIRRLELASGQIYNTFVCVCLISMDGSTWGVV